MDQLSQCPAYTLPAQSWRRLALNNPGRLIVVRKTQGIVAPLELEPHSLAWSTDHATR
jgi:hypothetical protein